MVVILFVGFNVKDMIECVKWVENVGYVDVWWGDFGLFDVFMIIVVFVYYIKLLWFGVVVMLVYSCILVVFVVIVNVFG